ncbi:BTB/POZ domain-containing protein At3g22104 [Telopea speciosissima]|uniref:BTB/POZ domain-containing protein At3g22104 n=1 Tax=Telopea speciosissima TaxID=54955 RepID=UPI001CC39794|nr:BTB/POZ domain-containing protein At3g22104 [Telopea speciosissima]XP_043706957.1 BTB/POZ domain-containing protein At3g22104 [Telopea speciosissima]
MHMCCDLEVDVNGQEIFMVDKKLLLSFSGKLNKLFGKSMATSKNLKVIFHDFPGGAQGFELMARFCYNNGQTEITPSNISLLHCVAHFMEMTKQISVTDNLIEQTEEFLEGITYWAWSELLVALKQCQEFMPAAISSGILQKCLDSLITRVAVSATEASPFTSSPDSSAFRFSCDTRSTESLKNSYSRVNWWFEDLASLSHCLIEKVLRAMIAQKFDHVILSRFLFYYQKSRISNARSSEKRKITEIVVQLLFLLDHSSVSCKSLFEILRVALRLNVNKCCRNRLENMIGSQLHQVTLDSLLIPSPPGTNYLYDVNLVLRFLKSFLSKGDCWASLTRLRKVASLMDLYIAEVAPDSCLKPSKFIALVTALPDSSRDSNDGIYQAMDMYLEVHSKLSEEEKMKICCALNYEKLSSDALKHLTRNSKFPSRMAVQALVSQHSMLKSLPRDNNYPKYFGDSPCSYSEKIIRGKEAEEDEQLVLYARNFDVSMENENLGTHLKGMQWRVSELEKVCRKMQTQMEKMMKSRLSSPSSARSLPRMCS